MTFFSPNTEPEIAGTYDILNKRVVFCFLENTGSNTYKPHYILCKINEDNIMFETRSSSNTYGISGVNSCYLSYQSNKIGEHVISYLDNGYVKCVLVKHEDTTTQESGPTVVSSGGGHEELRVLFDPVSEKFV